MDKEQAIMDSTNFWNDPSASGPPVDLLSFATVFVRRWPFLIAMSLGGFLVALVIAFLMTPQFTSRAVFLPPVEQAPPSDNPLALLLRPPSSNIYSGLLASDSILDEVIQANDLQTFFKAKDLEQTRTLARSVTSVSSDATGFVTLTVTVRDPKLAQAIASSYLTALAHLNDRLAISAAAQHRTIFQTEFERAKNDLEKSEVELKKVQEASGVVSPENQIRSGLSAIDLTRADIRAKQVALAAILKGQTDQSPDVQRLRSEIATEEAQLRQLQGAAGTKAAPGSGLTAAQAPGISLRFVELEREVKYHQVLFDVMARQYENARLQESSAAPGVQIVDYPQLPLHKSKPSRALISLVGLIAGFAFAVLLVFGRNRLEVLRQDPERARSLQALGGALKSPSLRP